MSTYTKLSAQDYRNAMLQGIQVAVPISNELEKVEVFNITDACPRYVELSAIDTKHNIVVIYEELENRGAYLLGQIEHRPSELESIFAKM